MEKGREEGILEVYSYSHLMKCKFNTQLYKRESKPLFSLHRLKWKILVLGTGFEKFRGTAPR